jgi:hypothetical protein
MSRLCILATLHHLTKVASGGRQAVIPHETLKPP